MVGLSLNYVSFSKFSLWGFLLPADYSIATLVARPSSIYRNLIFN
jgi:hypothetical protein